jgi:hypothetical protein
MFFGYPAEQYDENSITVRLSRADFPPWRKTAAQKTNVSDAGRRRETIAFLAIL